MNNESPLLRVLDNGKVVDDEGAFLSCFFTVRGGGGIIGSFCLFTDFIASWEKQFNVISSNTAMIEKCAFIF